MRLLASCTALVSAVVVVAQNPPKDEGFTVTKATILMLGWDQQDIWGSIIAAVSISQFHKQRRFD